MELARLLDDDDNLKDSVEEEVLNALKDFEDAEGAAHLARAAILRSQWSAFEVDDETERMTAMVRSLAEDHRLVERAHRAESLMAKVADLERGLAASRESERLAHERAEQAEAQLVAHSPYGQLPLPAAAARGVEAQSREADERCSATALTRPSAVRTPSPASAAELIEHLYVERGPESLAGSGLASTFEGALDKLAFDLYSNGVVFVQELLANADDAVYLEPAAGGCDVPAAAVVVAEDGVTFASNEAGLTEANVRAMCDIGASTKTPGGDKALAIGRKGIGFKSVFLCSDRPTVSSGPFAFTFDLTIDGMFGLVRPRPAPDAQRVCTAALGQELAVEHAGFACHMPYRSGDGPGGSARAREAVEALPPQSLLLFRRVRRLVTSFRPGDGEVRTVMDARGRREAVPLAVPKATLEEARAVAGPGTSRTGPAGALQLTHLSIGTEQVQRRVWRTGTDAWHEAPLEFLALRGWVSFRPEAEAPARDAARGAEEAFALLVPVVTEPSPADCPADARGRLFCHVPVGDLPAGIPFDVHSPLWELTASRQALREESALNLQLRDAIATAFVAAALLHESWGAAVARLVGDHPRPSTLPQGAGGGWWAPLVGAVAAALRSCVRSIRTEAGGLVAPAKARLRPRGLAPHTLNGNDVEAATGLYLAEDSSAARRMGCVELSGEELATVLGHLHRLGRLRQQPRAWFDQVFTAAATMLGPAEVASGPTIEATEPVAATHALLSCPLVPICWEMARGAESSVRRSAMAAVIDLWRYRPLIAPPRGPAARQCGAVTWVTTDDTDDNSAGDWTPQALSFLRRAGVLAPAPGIPSTLVFVDALVAQHVRQGTARPVPRRHGSGSRVVWMPLTPLQAWLGVWALRMVWPYVEAADDATRTARLRMALTLPTAGPRPGAGHDEAPGDAPGPDWTLSPVSSLHLSRVLGDVCIFCDEAGAPGASPPAGDAPCADEAVGVLSSAHRACATQTVGAEPPELIAVAAADQAVPWGAGSDKLPAYADVHNGARLGEDTRAGSSPSDKGLALDLDGFLAGPLQMRPHADVCPHRRQWLALAAALTVPDSLAFEVDEHRPMNADGVRNLRADVLSAVGGDCAMCFQALHPRSARAAFAADEDIVDGNVARSAADMDDLPVALQAFAQECTHGDGSGAEMAGEPAMLRCGHVFHTDCLRRWWDKVEDKSCPFCRQPTSSEGTLQPALATPPALALGERVAALLAECGLTPWPSWRPGAAPAATSMGALWHVEGLVATLCTASASTPGRVSSLASRAAAIATLLARMPWPRGAGGDEGFRAEGPCLARAVVVAAPCASSEACGLPMSGLGLHGLRAAAADRSMPVLVSHGMQHGDRLAAALRSLGAAVGGAEDALVAAVAVLTSVSASPAGPWDVEESSMLEACTALYSGVQLALAGVERPEGAMVRLRRLIHREAVVYLPGAGMIPGSRAVWSAGKACEALDAVAIAGLGLHELRPFYPAAERFWVDSAGVHGTLTVSMAVRMLSQLARDHAEDLYMSSDPARCAAAGYRLVASFSPSDMDGGAELLRSLPVPVHAAGGRVRLDHAHELYLLDDALGRKLSVDPAHCPLAKAMPVVHSPMLGATLTMVLTSVGVIRPPSDLVVANVVKAQRWDLRPLNTAAARPAAVANSEPRTQGAEMHAWTAVATRVCLAHFRSLTGWAAPPFQALRVLLVADCSSFSTTFVARRAGSSIPPTTEAVTTGFVLRTAAAPATAELVLADTPPEVPVSEVRHHRRATFVRTLSVVLASLPNLPAARTPGPEGLNLWTEMLAVEADHDDDVACIAALVETQLVSEELREKEMPLPAAPTLPPVVRLAPSTLQERPRAGLGPDPSPHFSTAAGPPEAAPSRRPLPSQQEQLAPKRQAPQASDLRPAPVRLPTPPSAQSPPCAHDRSPARLPGPTRGAPSVGRAASAPVRRSGGSCDSPPLVRCPGCHRQFQLGPAVGIAAAGPRGARAGPRVASDAARGCM